MTDIDKRNFYLMLSVSEGQTYAHQMGFSPPSVDVEDVELADVMSRWGVLMATEVYSEITEGSQWFTDFLEKSDKLISPKEEIISVFTVFGMALLNKLIESEKILLMLDQFELEGDDYE